MGRKKKTGKNRLDKYYWLARESGFKSRAAYKLIQLHKEFELLKQARRVVDLCAAPGGWTQVCVKFCPVNSLIIACDLYKIQNLPGAVLLQGDITTTKTKNEIIRELKGQLADIVLHDGSPNVGGAWTKDAYSQLELSLLAVKLATAVLKPNGVFVTKVFRSQDYNSFLWACQQLFAKVIPHKPNASRQSSAETYLVCKGYYAPRKIDPRLLDPQFVFKQAIGYKKKVSVIKERPSLKQKPNRKGYDSEILFKIGKVLDWVNSTDPIGQLGEFNELRWDKEAEDKFGTHESTTEEIRICLSDLKVLGHREFKRLIKWRLTIKALLDGVEDQKEDESNVVVEPIELTQEELENRKIEQQKQDIKDMFDRFAKERKKRKKLLRRQKLQRRRDNARKTDFVPSKVPLFSVIPLKDKENLERILEGETADLRSPSPSSTSSDEFLLPEEAREQTEAMLDKLWDQYKEEKKIQKRLRKRELGLSSDEEDETKVEDEKEEPLDEALKEPPKPEHPIIVDVPTPEEKREAKAERWYERTRIENDLMEDIDDQPEEVPVYEDLRGDDVLSREVLSSDADEEAPDAEMARLKKQKKKALKRKLGGSSGSAKKKSKKKVLPKNEDDAFLASESENESDSEPSDKELRKKWREDKEKKAWVDAEKKTIKKLKDMGCKVEHLLDKPKVKNRKQREKERKQAENCYGLFKEKDFARFIEVSASESWNSSDTDEVAEILALGKRMRTKKERLKIIEGSYCGKHRYNDQKGLPQWFLDDEEMNTRPPIPITRAEREFFKEQLKAVNARPIKRVSEAKARKKLRAMRRWAKLKHSANIIAESHIMSEQEKIRAIERIYAKGRKGREKRKVQLVQTNHKKTRFTRKRGYKTVLVDRRMKVDKRKAKERERRGRIPRGKKGSARLRAIQKRPWLLKKKS